MMLQTRENIESIGIVLSGATTSSAKCEIFSSAENRVEEGMIVIINSNKNKILSRVEKSSLIMNFTVKEMYLLRLEGKN